MLDPGIIIPESPGDKAEATLCKTSSKPTAYSVPPFLFCCPISLLVLLRDTSVINRFLRTLFSGSASGAPGPRQPAMHFCRWVVLGSEGKSKSPEEPVTMQISRSHPGDCGSVGWGPGICSLVSSLEFLLLVALGPHFENGGCRPSGDASSTRNRLTASSGSCSPARP